MRDTLGAILKRNYRVKLAVTGEEALAVLKREDVDLMLLDVRLPGINGLEVLKIVKENYNLIEAIMISAINEVETAVQAMKHGAYHYIAEEFDCDELFVTIQGRRHYPWRAIDQDGDVIDILIQSRRDRRAAARFFRKLLKGQGREPRRLITDKLHSYSAAHRTVMPSVVHSTQQYQNNRAQVSHQPTRQRERQMRRFTSAAHAQRFLSVHGLVLNLFRVGRHLPRAVHYRLLRTRSLLVWQEVTCAC